MIGANIYGNDMNSAVSSASLSKSSFNVDKNLVLSLASTLASATYLCSLVNGFV